MGHRGLMSPISQLPATTLKASPLCRTLSITDYTIETDLLTGVYKLEEKFLTL